VRVPVEPIPFGPFCLDAARSRLMRDGVEIEIRPQALHVLRVLAQNSGRHVNYEQMIHEAWNGTLVSKHTVAVTVGEVKKILGEFGPWISYRPRMGYYFEAFNADDLVRQGRHCWSRCTREGFEKALCYFERAAKGSNDPRVFEGASQHAMRGPLFPRASAACTGKKRGSLPGAGAGRRRELGRSIHHRCRPAAGSTRGSGLRADSRPRVQRIVSSRTG
jgi:DNA-binding winged helix-turn-helix (wHTH) protein